MFVVLKEKKEYMKKFQKVVAIDFDGTITKRDNRDCNIEEIRPYAARMINKLYRDGYIIIINSLRNNDKDKIINFLKKKRVKFHYFNENEPTRIAYYGDTRKIAADIYIDDRGLYGIPDDWRDIYTTVRQSIGIPYTQQELAND